MEKEFWLQRWQEQQIGFHEGRFNNSLVQYWPQLKTPKAACVFVPLCGKSQDMVFFAEQGMHVIGIELSALAVEAFFQEQDLTPDVSQEGELQCYRAGPYTLYCGDVFALHHEHLKDCHWVYDRAALIALPYESTIISSRAIASDEFLFACAPDHPLAKRVPLTAEDLSSEALLLLEDGHCLRDHVLSACSAGAARSDFAATSLHTLVQMVKSGLGATLLPAMAVKAGLVDRLGLTVKPFDPPIVGREIGIAWRKGSARADEAAQLGEAIRTLLDAD